MSSDRARAGKGGVLVIHWFDSAKNRYRLLTAEVGENGVEEGVFYCVRDGKLIRAEDQDPTPLHLREPRP